LPIAADGDGDGADGVVLYDQTFGIFI